MGSKKDFSDSALNMIEMMDGAPAQDRAAASVKRPVAKTAKTSAPAASASAPASSAPAASPAPAAGDAARRGRPPLPDGVEKRVRRVNLLVTPSLADDFAILARCRNLSMNSLMVRLMEEAVRADAAKIALFRQNFG